MRATCECSAPRLPSYRSLFIDGKYDIQGDITTYCSVSDFVGNVVGPIDAQMQQTGVKHAANHYCRAITSSTHQVLIDAQMPWLSQALALFRAPVVHHKSGS
jgi:hypothetical protein